jgi:glycosyltransferase involved in cell wall biosynthesis
MKVLFLTKYTRLGASSRLRTFQYIPELEKEGVDVVISSLFDNKYLNSLYQGKGRSRLGVLFSYFKRVIDLRGCKEFDLLWVEKEVFPYLPYWIERLLLPRSLPYVVDYDDAVFHNYDLSSNLLIRLFLGKKIDKVMSNAAVVVCGNDYLAQRAVCAGAVKVEVVPTVIDITRYHVSDNKAVTLPVVGWIGSPSTQKYIRNMKSLLHRVCGDGRARIILIGASPDLVTELTGTDVEILPWKEDKEAQMITNLDIGIMPLKGGLWEKGKCGYKLIQYMASGLPVIASPVGVNTEIVEHGVNGFLAETYDEWEIALCTLINDSDLRLRMGRAGREKVERQYSLQVTGPKLVKLLIDAAETASSSV